MAVLILEHNLIDAEKHKIKQETPAATKKEYSCSGYQIRVTFPLCVSCVS